MSSEASGRRWRRALTLLAALVGGSPGLVVASEAVPWKPGGISSPQFESHAAFDPRTGDLYFVRSSPAFEGWRILVSHCTATGWSEPEAPAFAGNGVEADPYFTADGGSLYFISTRSPNGAPRKDLDVWRVDRDPKGVWGAPTRLPEPVNSSGAEWFPRPSPDGWLYFGSKRPGGLGGNDIWRARADAEGRWRAENLGPTVNTTGNEYEPLPSADGSRLIVMADGGLYETRNTPSGWSARLKLGADVNVNGTEIGPLFSPSGRSLLFSRDTKGSDSGEFFVWHEGGAEAWPPECPPATPSPATVASFQATEQALMGAIAPGDKTPWERIMDPSCVFTTEEGEVLSRQQFLSDLRPLPAGLTGDITVKDLTVQAFPDFAVVRFLADESEIVFGRKLATQYRMTDTFRRDGAEWKMVASHASVVTHDPPEQPVSTNGWPGLVGRYRLLPDGWTFTVELREGKLYGGRDPKKLRPLIPLTPNAFVVSGSLGEWIFVTDERGQATRILSFRKFEPLVWSRVD